MKMRKQIYELNQAYVTVNTPEGNSYGGSQSFSPQKTMARCGCGVVAALDWLLYLQSRTTHRISFLPDPSEPIDTTLYARLLHTLSKKYFPLVYPTGINGILLAGGMNLLFLREGLPYRASWRITKNGFWSGMKDMLFHDLPVIMAVGPNFPRLLTGKGKATLLDKDLRGNMRPSTAISAHYMSVTAIEGDYLHLSSWGKEYWISRASYEEYIHKHSNYILSNILYIKEI